MCRDEQFITWVELIHKVIRESVPRKLMVKKQQEFAFEVRGKRQEVGALTFKREDLH